MPQSKGQETPGSGERTPAGTHQAAPPAQRLAQAARSGLARAAVAALNTPRRLARRPVGFVVLRLDPPLPERDPSARPFPLSRLPGLARRPLSLAELRRRVDHLAAAPQVPGVVFALDTIRGSMANAQALRALIHRARRAGKRTVAYLSQVDTLTYYVATACDTIIAPPEAEFNAVGLRISALFLRDTLARAGLQFEVVAVSPYKAAGDALTRTEMSAEHRANLEWVLDDLFTQVVTAISEGRRLAPARVRTLLDQAPFSMAQAVELGLVDAALHEDELGAYLGSSTEPATLLTWHTARRRLPLRYRPHPERAMGIVSIGGMILDGVSRRPPPLPVPVAEITGARTVIQALRRALGDQRIAAIILAIDSSGGSATACATIAREVSRIRPTKPIVAYLGPTAASGGYYVAAPCNAIIAQAGTVTGSIGALITRPVLGGVYARVGAGHVELIRGQNAGLYSGTAPWTQEQRQRMQAILDESYDRFKRVVADGRRLDIASLDEVALGRVWTGRQAVAHGLADCLGDLSTAIEYARSLAGLPLGSEPHVVDIRPRGPELLPEPGEAAAWLSAVLQPLSSTPQPLALAPWVLHIGA